VRQIPPPPGFANLALAATITWTTDVNGIVTNSDVTGFSVAQSQQLDTPSPTYATRGDGGSDCGDDRSIAQGDLFFKIEKVGKVEHGNAAVAVTVTFVNIGTHPVQFGHHDMKYQLTQGGKQFTIELANPGLADEQQLDSHQSTTRRSIQLVSKGVADGEYILTIRAYGSQDQRPLGLH
jgi:hypothetical protein